jgi:aspartate carbamoyltransferase catalytic subunit
MQLKRKDLLSIRDLTAEEILMVLDTAESFKEVGSREIKKVPTLRGKTVVNLFLEPSTRTRTSFELAAKRLSADVINVAVATSSLAKGETLLDTARNLEAMRSDAIVLRHPSSGAADLLARRLRSAIINAGDGRHEHPTQALLDLYTIRERKRRLDGLTVAIVGDIANSRVARSNLHAMKLMGMTVRLCGPPTLIPRDADRWGVEIHHRIETAVAGADVVMMLRLQTERQAAGLIPSLREYARHWALTAERVQLAGPEVLIMHPGPIHRGVEMDPEVADSIGSVILDQTTNGIAVRMAVLYLLLGGRAEA